RVLPRNALHSLTARRRQRSTTRPLCLRLRFYCTPRRLKLRPRPLYLHRSPLCLPVYIYSREAFGTFDFRVFYSLSLRLTLAVSTPVVSFRSTLYSVCII
ncbi:unnamed protein product, partial [Ascophyllum nodosum]